METPERLFFDVKGLLHPPDRVIAYLRYYPDNRGTRFRDGVRYMKVYDLQKRRRLLESRWSHYVYCDEVQGRELQGVPKASVLQLYTPQQGLTALLHSRRKDKLERNAAKLIETLADESGLPSGSFGISGSLLVGLHQRASDIDIVVYGAEISKRVQQALSALLEKDQDFHRYRTRDLKRLYVQRSMQQAVSLRDFESQEQRKAFQGKFLSHDYFIRCIKDWEEITERYGDTRYVPMGECALAAQVVDDTESLLTPCRYLIGQVQVLSGDIAHIPREVVSFRGRFAEQARAGERVFARGILEAVRSGGSQDFRLVVGEGLTDVLRTIG